MTITEFLLARWDELEAEARRNDDPNFYPEGRHPDHVDYVLADIEAKRRIVELHDSWPVLVTTSPEIKNVDTDPTSFNFRVTQKIDLLTQQEYRTRFGFEPPTAPIIAEMAAVYADHPDYDEAWRL